MFEIGKRRKEVANLLHSNVEIKQEQIEIVDHIKQELIEEDDYITSSIVKRHVDLLLRTAELKDKQNTGDKLMTNVRDTTDLTTTDASTLQIIKSSKAAHCTM